MEQCYSGTIAVKSDICQGGILSPVFFNIYADEIINSLQKSDFGCHTGREYVGCIVYADDVLLLSVAVVHLQRMLDVSVECTDKLDIVLMLQNQLCLKLVKSARRS